jgi:hypothetical protein
MTCAGHLTGCVHRLTNAIPKTIFMVVGVAVWHRGTAVAGERVFGMGEAMPE